MSKGANDSGPASGGVRRKALVALGGLSARSQMKGGGPRAWVHGGAAESGVGALR